MILHLPLTDCEEGPSLCTQVMTTVAVLLVIITFPFSLLLVVKVVQTSRISHQSVIPGYFQEFERAVTFRLGRLLPKARGPGVFFVLPCVDAYEIIDMRTQTFNVPPQEV